MMCCPLAASLSRACAHASRSCSSRSTRTARSRPSHLWVQRGAENRILTPTTFLQQQQSCGFKRCRRACTGASLGGELSAVRRQFRSPHRSRKRVPKRSRKNSRSRKRAPNPSRKNSRSRRVKESFEPLRDSSAPAAPLNPPVLNELPERLQSATSSIRPSLEYGGVGLGAAGTLAAIPAARLAGEHRGPTPVDGQSEVYLYCQRPGGARAHVATSRPGYGHAPGVFFVMSFCFRNASPDAGSSNSPRRPSLPPLAAVPRFRCQAQQISSTNSLASVPK